MPDIRDLADYLGLSVGTVSRALNGRPEVGRKTRDRVLEAARAIGYMPNQAGRALRQGSTRMFGFVLGNAKLSFQKDGALLFDVVGAIQSELARHKLDLVVFPGPGNEEVTQYVRRLAQRHIVDGLVVTDMLEDKATIRYHCETAQSLRRFGHGGGAAGASTVEIDLAAVVLGSVRRLSALGHSKIALALGSRYAMFSTSFTRVFEREMKSLGHVVRQDYIFNCFEGAASGYLLAREIIDMDDRPTAIVALERDMVIGFYRGLGEAGSRPGREISLVGPISIAGKTLPFPDPSGYRVDLRELGKAIVGKLLSGSAGEASPEESQPAHVKWPLTVVDGESASQCPGPNGLA